LNAVNAFSLWAERASITMDWLSLSFEFHSFSAPHVKTNGNTAAHTSWEN
jgi:hypothetical protein